MINNSSGFVEFLNNASRLIISFSVQIIIREFYRADMNLFNLFTVK